MAYSRSWAVTLGGASPQEIEGVLVTCNYLDVLQVRPVIGSGFTATNCESPSAPPAVVLSHGLWTRVFAADREIVRKTIMLNGQSVAVAGVAAEGFDGIDITKAAFFAPTSLQPVLRPGDDYHRDGRASWLTVVGRRKDGVSIAQVATGLACGLAPALQASTLDVQTLLKRDGTGAGRGTGGWLRGTLIGVQTAVCMLLLISAGLLLRGLYAAETVEPGFDYHHVAVMSFDLRGPGYDEQRAVAFQRQLIQRVGSLPGVEAVAHEQDAVEPRPNPDDVSVSR